MEQCPGGPGWPAAGAGEEKEGGNRREQEGREKRTGEKSCDFFLKAVTPRATPLVEDGIRFLQEGWVRAEAAG